MEKENIIVDIERCTECLRCQLICSLTHTGSFNPEASCIVIRPPKDIHFTEECRKRCTLCTLYCDRGAIKQEKQG